MLVDFDHAQTIFVILVDDCLNTRRLTGSAISKKQYVVGFLALHKRLCVVHKFLLLNLISDKIIEHNGIHIVDRTERNTAPRLLIDTKRLVESEHTDTKILSARTFSLTFLLYMRSFLWIAL